MIILSLLGSATFAFESDLEGSWMWGVGRPCGVNTFVVTVRYLLIFILL